MNEDFFLALDLLEKEKGIPKEYMIEKVTKALGDSYKKEYGGSTNVKVVVDSEKKELRMYQQMTVVEEITDPQTEILLSEAKKHSKRAKEGDVVDIEVKPKNFRRLSAQNGKQILVQGMREAERNMIIKEYESKREEIITAKVTKIDPVNGNVVLDTGTSSATLLKGEQIPDEVFEVGDYVKVFVTEVRRELHGPIVTLSRKHPGLV